MMLLLFYLSLFFIFYTYLLYPCILWLGAKYYPKPLRLTPQPVAAVSVILAVYNEEQHIINRLKNLLAQNYPPDKLNIIIVSDGSSDKTPVLVSNFIAHHQLNTTTVIPKIQLIHYPNNQGKAHAINVGVAQATTDLLIMADARQQFAPDCIRQLVMGFADKQVAAVSGQLSFRDTQTKTAMGAYWHYEKWIRQRESQIASVIGVTGCVYALRKTCYHPIPANTLLDDVLIPMKCIKQGYRVIFANNAHAYDMPSQHAGQEWRRKVRTLAGNWQLLNLDARLFSPKRNPLWWQFYSHKIARLIVPLFLLLLLFSSWFVATWFFIVQIAGYAVVAIASIFPILRKCKLINLMHTFTFLNLAAVTGFYYWVTRQTDSVW